MQPAQFDRIFLAALSVMLMLLSFGYIFLITTVPPSTPAAQHYADIILGFILGTVVAGVVGFFFGNSKRPEPTVAVPATTTGGVKL